MTRDEVVERLEVLAGQYERALGHSLVADVFEDRAKLLRAAAEIIRESGWRPIAEFTDENEYLTGGRWDQGKWYEYSGKLYWLLAHRCTHARVSPEPPAREASDGRA